MQALAGRTEAWEDDLPHVLAPWQEVEAGMVGLELRCQGKAATESDPIVVPELVYSVQSCCGVVLQGQNTRQKCFGVTVVLYCALHGDNLIDSVAWQHQRRKSHPCHSHIWYPHIPAPCNYLENPLLNSFLFGVSQELIDRTD